MIHNIIFNFGRVLVDYDYDNFLKTIVSDPNERAQFTELTCNPSFVEHCDRGVKTFKELIAELQKEYPHWYDYLKAFHDRQIDAMTNEVPGMRSLLLKLRAEGYGLYGLTNWSCAVYDVIEKFDILKMMDGTLISSEEKLIKPDLSIYQRCCHKFNLHPQECIFTDDKLINVEGARNAGMYAIHFKNAKQLEFELKEIINLALND